MTKDIIIIIIIIIVITIIPAITFAFEPRLLNCITIEIFAISIT